MIFVLDVGNTNTVLGVYDGDELKYHWRVETSRNKTEDEYGMTIKALLEHVSLSFKDIHGIIISSVVPPIMFALERMCQKYFHLKPLVVGPGIKTGLNIKYENPREVGADRIVNAVAGIQLYGSPLIIVDFGTATTYCYIDENKQYMGGAIASGINISTEALYSRSYLSFRELKLRDQIALWGKIQYLRCKQVFLYGYVGQVEGIVARMKEQATVNPKVIATGGLA